MLIDFRERGKEEERKEGKHHELDAPHPPLPGRGPAAQTCVLAGNQPGHPSANGTRVQPTEPHHTGPHDLTLITLLLFVFSVF